MCFSFSFSPVFHSGIPTRDNNPIMNACDDVMNQSAAVKVTEADAECTRTWWGCPTPSPSPKTGQFSLIP